MPEFMGEIVAELSQLARQSPHLNQHSGVSVRLSITNYETLVANALRTGASSRRTRRRSEGERPRGARELDPGQGRDRGLEEGREERILQRLVSAAVLAVFRRRVRDREPRLRVVAAFDDKRVVHAGDDLPASAYADTLSQVPELEALSRRPRRLGDAGCRGERGGARLEGLHLTKRLNKDAAGSRAAYRARS